MREIVLDTETTGFDPETGDRIVEIGAVELMNHLPTGRTFHKYLNPQRDVPAEAVAVHGLTDEFLRDKPLFADVAAEFVTEESRDVVPKPELDAFHDDVDALRDDVERLAARIARLPRAGHRA